MKISGLMVLRNVVSLSYPFELAIRSLRPLCDEVVVLVDPTSEDDTVGRVRALAPDRIVESVWDMGNHSGHVHGEIAKQTAIAVAAAGGDWVLSLQADEVLHERDAGYLRAVAERSGGDGISGIELPRLYFFGGLDAYREDWTFDLLRFFARGRWLPDPKSGAMQFVPATPAERKRRVDAAIYHYSRVGDPAVIARRVRNLDTFYHDPEKVTPESEVPAYDFALRKLDTYVRGHVSELEAGARLLRFPVDGHPAGVREYFALEIG